MSEQAPFLQRALDGAILDVENEVDDAVAEWHTRGGRRADGTEIPLADWLGMSEDEYALFVEQPGSLRAILQVRAYGGNLGQVLRAANQDAIILAARGASSDDIKRIIQWLRSSGRLN